MLQMQPFHCILSTRAVMSFTRPKEVERWNIFVGAETRIALV